MSGTRANLLIADDDTATRMLLSQIFAEETYSVRTAADGFSALVEIQRAVPEILISDLNMPGMSGFELLMVVRRRFPEIRVIAMSDEFSGDDIPSGVAADAFFQKGGGFGALSRILRSLPRPERMAQQPQAAPPPVWVSRYQRNSDGEGYVRIECPECMGTFPKALEGAIDPNGEVNCLYCGSAIRYAVVQPNQRAAVQALSLPRKRRHSAPALGPMQTLAS